MKKINRLKRNEDFTRVIKEGHTFKNSSFVVHVKQNSLNLTRIGLSVSKKNGDAVTRNKIKRQLRAMVIDFVKQNNPIDVVIIVRADYQQNNYQDNCSLLYELLTGATK